MEDFDIAVATLAESDDAVAVELLAQLRPNGRILDNFRLVANGSQILNVELAFNPPAASGAAQGLQAPLPVLGPGHSH
jgi:hypothetical protein